MRNVTLNSLELIIESNISETHTLENVDENLIADEILDLFDSFDELEYDLEYTEDMVPVIETKTSLGYDYLVEYENLVKLINTYERKDGFCNEEMALRKLADHYSVQLENVVLVLESEEAYRRTVFNISEKIKREKSPENKHRLRMKLNDIKEKMRRLKENEKLRIIRKKIFNK